MTAAVFPGQGSQYVGMGKDLYQNYPAAKNLFDKANEILHFDLTQIMFEGTDEELKQTKVTQVAVFLHSIASFTVLNQHTISMVAGHSLGEYTALVACKALSFEDALVLVSKRAAAMQKACVQNPSTMLAVVGLEEEKIQQICNSVKGEVVTVANYNSPSQIIVSGTMKGIEEVATQVKELKARAIPLNVGGAFHSPLMQSAEEELKQAIIPLEFDAPICPIYQNIDGKAHTNPQEIKQNLIAQLTKPVQWTQTIQNMIADGASEFAEFGPGNVLKGLIKKINSEVICIEQ